MDNSISYIEFNASNIQEIKKFYSQVFGWSFKDYGPDYTSFSESGVLGGFQRTNDEIINGVLVVLYHKNLKATMKKIIEAGGEVSKEIISFPGGSRFQFKDPSGNELAVWSDK